MAEAIQVKGLVKAYKRLPVLRGVDLEVKKGSIYALLGPNGAGKTTTIKILATLVKPDGGAARVAGYDILRQPQRVRESISLTGQNAAVDDVLTGRENLRMIGKLRHLPDAAKRADELLARFDLADAADRRAGAYSGGMRRRLDLAMSLMGSPSVIFLDEPTTGLDPQSRLQMWKIIRDLSHGGITVFLTTQYLEEADHLADRIAILKDGTIVAEGTAAELKKRLPHGHIELRFGDEGALRAAYELLSEYGASEDEQSQTLSVVTDGSIRQMTDILNRLETAGVPAAEFAQKKPTLEDVFLAIVGDDTGKEDVQ